MEDRIILSQSEYSHLLEEIRLLQARITELTALRDDLIYHVCPALQAEYDEKILSLERELMAANMYLHEMQRTLEILQAQINQRQKPSMDQAEAQAKQENKQFEEDLRRKAEEAWEFRKKWEETQWAKHDRQSQEAGKKKRYGSDSASYSSSSSGEHTGGTREGSADDQRTGREESTAQKIKKLYRKIVKRLHPDVHPNPTEREKDLLNQAMEAFRDGDLGKLQRIWDELSGMDAPEDEFDDTPEGRKKLRELIEKLKIRLRRLELEIEHIKADFPYKMKAFLEDEEAVEEKRRSLQAQIENVREMNRKLEAVIKELREKLRRGEKL